MSESKAPAPGLPMAVGAYLIWGLIPLYFAALHEVPPLEMVGLRVLFTVPVCFAIVAIRKQWPQLRVAFASPRLIGALALSAALIAINWLIYVTAITTGHVFAASLGYYINPLVNVLAGTVLLGERLSRLQWTAVAVAAVGVALLAAGAASTLWISLSLAVTFCAYGLVRKLVPVTALPGLTVETVLLAPVALLVVMLQPGGSSLGESATTDGLLALSGIFTGVPLLLFAAAARRMPYSLLGMVQYLAPTIVFLLGLFVFAEPLVPVQLACFVLIWAAVALFVFDLVSRQRRGET